MNMQICHAITEDVYISASQLWLTTQSNLERPQEICSSLRISTGLTQKLDFSGSCDRMTNKPSDHMTSGQRGQSQRDRAVTGVTEEVWAWQGPRDWVWHTRCSEQSEPRQTSSRAWYQHQGLALSSSHRCHDGYDIIPWLRLLWMQRQYNDGSGQ